MIKEIESLELQEKMCSEDAPILLDIRSANELMQGMLPDSEHLPMHLLPLKIAELPQDREIVLYCRTGARTFTACNFLMQQGYTNVSHLRGGIISWAQHGLEIVLPSQVSNY